MVRQPGSNAFAPTRWTSEASFKPEWDQRVQWMLGFLPPGTSSLVDLGAGRKAAAAMLLPSVSYHSVDYSDVFGADVVIDLNTPFDPKLLPPADVVLISGVLEYMVDVPLLLSILRNKYSTVIASYNPVSIPASRRSEVSKRRQNGWVNDYSIGELVRRFEHARYRIVHVERFGADHQANNTLLLGRAYGDMGVPR